MPRLLRRLPEVFRYDENVRLLKKAEIAADRVGVLSGAFHPVTRAHVALAKEALNAGEAGEVLFVMPAVQPHKEYERVSLADRIQLLLEAVEHESRFSVGLSEGGLFLEIARECREHYRGATLRFLCGRDTAERIVNWRYEGHPPIERQLEEFELLVAPRQGVYQPPSHLQGSIGQLVVDADYDWISSTEVRQRIAAGEQWRHLVPEAVVDRVGELYG